MKRSKNRKTSFAIAIRGARHSAQRPKYALFIEDGSLAVGVFWILSLEEVSGNSSMIAVPCGTIVPSSQDPLWDNLLSRKDNASMQCKKTLRFLPALLWMGVIFYLSSQDGTASGSLSGGFSDLLYGLLRFLRIPLNESALHFLLRKGAHFTAYLLLGLLYAYALEARTLREHLRCLLLAFLYAASDEYHQIFVPGRSGEVRDVLIDTSGAFLGLTARSLWHLFRERRASRKDLFYEKASGERF